ncbi:alcohol dehydrogenase [Aspergillus heteromorphus CBS 117.55]|uniref:Alcohol dehydrogenase n=1 Tax=Aspergillus heteromorphus CBS 117.55 TaxID=1448321 RepID=A0A317X0W4_9EURO|nr:alcohol dehydrogenase [Aspergillus heteromorphus CBS 117.55]PWY92193.1 alcohol dehydrogenase [Aspergillus heteromorphus CBS 117.55]
MAATANALVMREIKGPLSVEKVQLGELRADEVLVEVHATGICHTDISCMNGQLPASAPCVFGHEGAGVVVRTGSNVTHLTPNDKVLLSYAFCGNCEQCLSGHPAYCYQWVPSNFGQQRSDGSFTLSFENGDPLRGNFFGQSSFASLAIVHVSCVVKVAPDSPLDRFAPLGCGFQTGAGAVLNTLDVQPGTSLAVFGAGSVGMSAIMAGKLRGAQTIIAVDLNKERLALAKKLGATHTMLGSDEDIVQQIQAICPPMGVQYAVDCTGVPVVVEKAIQALGARGKLATVGAPSPGKTVQVDVFAQLVFGRQYVGCCEGDAQAEKILPYLIEQHAQGNYPIEELITTYPIEQYGQAISDMKSGKTLKAVLLWR